MRTIVLDCLQEQITPDCLDKFSKIAYQCLQRDRKERPQVGEIVTQLQNALRYQVSFILEMTNLLLLFLINT